MDFNLQTGNSQTADNQYNQHYINEIMVMLGVFSKDAMTLASTYCVHSGRNSVTTKDTELGLKTRAFYGDTFWNRNDIQHQITQMRQFLNEAGSESESESESESDYEYDENIDEGEMSELPDELPNKIEGFLKSNCTCELCITLNGIEDKWNTWIPYERRDISLKNSIDSTFN